MLPVTMNQWQEGERGEDLKEVPGYGEAREAGAEHGVAERTVASCRRRRRGGGGGGCDGSSGVRAEAREEPGPGRKGRWERCAVTVRRRHGGG